MSRAMTKNTGSDLGIDILKQSTYGHACTSVHMHTRTLTHTHCQGSYVDVHTKCMIILFFFLSAGRKLNVEQEEDPDIN